MRTLQASPRAPFVLAIAALSAFALHCSSEDPASPGGVGGTTTAPLGGSGGSTAGSFATAGGGSGGAATGGTGLPVAGSTAGGGSGGLGGGGAGAVAGGGAGGASTGGAGGSGGGGGAGGTPGATFADVKAIIMQSCKGTDCHNAGSMFHMDWVTESTLYTNLTTPIPNTKPMQHCKGTTVVTPGNAEGSFLIKVLKGKSMCMNGNMMEEIDKMPDECPSKRECLTEAQIKTISDWINAGAKM
jgi:hypothetical protein